MLILSRVCAEFHDKSGQTIFNITPQNLLSFLTAPDAIQEDPLFRLMLADGSLEAVRSVDQRKKLENDPAAGVTAEGRKAAAGSPSEPAAESGVPTILSAAATPAPAEAGLPASEASEKPEAPTSQSGASTAAAKGRKSAK